RRRHTRCYRDWSSDVCSSDLETITGKSGQEPALFTLASLLPLNSLTVIIRYCAQTPPSTGSVWPVTNRASSDSSHTTASAISSRSEERRVGKGERYQGEG